MPTKGLQDEDSGTGVVLQLVPKPPPKPNKLIIDIISKYLAKAMAGELIDITIVGLTEKSVSYHTAAIDPVRMLGAVHQTAWWQSHHLHLDRE